MLELKEKVRRHYEAAAEFRYRRLQDDGLSPVKLNHQLRGRIIRRFLERTGPFGKGLDIGTGTGVWAEVLAEYCDEAVGVDFAEKNVRIASQSAEERGLAPRLSYQIGDAETLERIPEATYDVALSISVLQHLERKELALRRVAEILKRGGAFILLVHNRRCVYNRNLRAQRRRGEELGVNEYSTLPGIRRQLVDAGFEVQGVRLCWLCLQDLLFAGSHRPFLRPLAPLRRGLIHASCLLEKGTSRAGFLNALYREIVILARKC